MSSSSRPRCDSLISWTGSCRRAGASHRPSALRGTCLRSPRPMANRSSRDVGRCRSEPNASPSAVAKTVCAPGPVVTSITSAARLVSFYQSSRFCSDAKPTRVCSRNGWLAVFGPTRKVPVLDAMDPEPTSAFPRPRDQEGPSQTARRPTSADARRRRPGCRGAEGVVPRWPDAAEAICSGGRRGGAPVKFRLRCGIPPRRSAAWPVHDDPPRRSTEGRRAGTGASGSPKGATNPSRGAVRRRTAPGSHSAGAAFVAALTDPCGADRPARPGLWFLGGPVPRRTVPPVDCVMSCPKRLQAAVKRLRDAGYSDACDRRTGGTPCRPVQVSLHSRGRRGGPLACAPLEYADLHEIRTFDKLEVVPPEPSPPSLLDERQPAATTPPVHGHRADAEQLCRLHAGQPVMLSIRLGPPLVHVSLIGNSSRRADARESVAGPRSCWSCGTTASGVIDAHTSSNLGRPKLARHRPGRF